MKYDLQGCINAYDMSAYFGKDDFLYFWKHDIEPLEVTYACFSQWYPSEFVVDGVRYNCAEQYMMAEKARVFGDERTREKILKTEDPERIKKLGREVKGFDANRWDKISEEVVLKGNLHKFGQNMKLFILLLNTGNMTLVEASPYDKIWGIGMTAEVADRYGYPHVWKGKNKLGFILMEVRDILRDIYEKLDLPC